MCKTTFLDFKVQPICWHLYGMTLMKVVITITFLQQPMESKFMCLKKSLENSGISSLTSLWYSTINFPTFSVWFSCGERYS